MQGQRGEWGLPGAEGGETGSCFLIGTEFPFCKMQRVPRWMAVMVAQQGDLMPQNLMLTNAKAAVSRHAYPTAINRERGA